MKRIILFLVVMSGLSLIPGGCAYITGETIDFPEAAPSQALPRWVWSATDGPYSIIIDRNTLKPIRDVTVMEAFGIIGTSSHSENPVVLDVRTPGEFAGGHLRDALNIDYLAPSFRDDIAGLEKDKLYIVYCRTGVRSSDARNIMEDAGFRHVINVTGGYTDWVAAGLPVSK